MNDQFPLPKRKSKQRVIFRDKKTDEISSFNPAEILDDVYRIIKKDVDRLDGLNELTPGQSRTLNQHGDFLIRALREDRIAEQEAIASTKDFTDEELKAHLKKLLEGPTNG